jgi:lipopolysaccharide export system permease protein
MTLHAYFARRYLATFMTVFGAFFLILSLFDMLEQIRRFGNDGVTFWSLLALTFLNVPKSIYRILPLVTIIAAIFYFLALARSSELVVARASGRAIGTTLLAPVTVAVLLGIAAVAILNPIVAATMARYETVADDFREERSTLSVSREGLWLRQADEEGQTVIRAARLARRHGTRRRDLPLLRPRRPAGPADRGGEGAARHRGVGDRGGEGLAARQRQSRAGFAHGRRAVAALDADARRDPRQLRRPRRHPDLGPACLHRPA